MDPKEKSKDELTKKVISCLSTLILRAQKLAEAELANPQSMNDESETLIRFYTNRAQVLRAHRETFENLMSKEIPRNI